MAIGTLITLVACACYTVTWEIYFKLSPGFSERYAAHMVDQVRASGASQAQIDAKDRRGEEVRRRCIKNPLINSAMTFIEPLPVGLLIALVSAGILRRRREGAGPRDDVASASVGRLSQRLSAEGSARSL